MIMNTSDITKKEKQEPVFDVEGRINYDTPSRWDAAYRLYTYGNAPSLTRSQRFHMVEVLNQKKYNLRLLILGLIWVVLFFLFLLIGPAGAFHNTSGLVTGIFAFLHLGLYVWNLRKYIVAPFDLLHLLMPELIICTFAYFVFWQL